MLLPATPGWVSLPVVVCGSPPLLAGACWRRWCMVCGVWCVVCGVRRWCVGGVVAGVWCGWSLATPGGGSCVLLPATPGWVSLPVVVGGPRHSWLRLPGAVPRHSWLGSVGGGGVRWGCGWCVVWSVPRHSWRRFLRATPRHSWLGFAAGGGVWSPATPGWGLLAAVVCGVWCVVCGVWCVVCGVRPWCAGGVAAGVWCGLSLATPGGGSCVLLRATPGWVSLPAVVRVPRHSWWRVPGAVPRHSWLGFAVGGGVWCVVCGVWRVVCGGGVCGGFVAGVWCGWSLATPGGGSCVLLPATPGWVSLPVVVWGSPPLLAGARRLWWCVSRAGVSFVVCVCGVCGCARWPCCVVCCVFVVSVFLVVWCGGAVGVSSGCPSPWFWCVCVRCVALRVGVGGVGGGGSCAVWLPCVCVCVLAVCGWWGGVCHTLAGSRRRSSAWFKKQKKRSCRCVAELRGMRDA